MTGIHKSPKCPSGPFKYRSSWELATARYFDENPLVVSYEYESIKIPYISNKKSGKIRSYIPDFLVTFLGGRKVLVEVKRISALNQLKVRQKAQAARIWAAQNKMVYEFYTDDIIKAFKETQKYHDLYNVGTNNSK